MKLKHNKRSIIKGASLDSIHLKTQGFFFYIFILHTHLSSQNDDLYDVQ